MELWTRIVELFRRNRLDGELDDEVSFHLSLLEEKFRAQGMSDSEARGAARREFGGVAHAKEAYREERGMPGLENLARDARYGWRGLRRNPGFTAAAVLSLALGIGANTAVFSLFHAIMLQSLPVAHPEQLVQLYRSGGWGFHGISSYPLYLDLAGHRELFEGVLATNGAAKVRFRATAGARTEFVSRELVSGDYFRTLGAGAAMGRVFTAEDDRAPQGHPLAVLSYEFWRDHLDSDGQILGRTLMVAEQPLTVIGVAAPRFRGVQVETHTDVWVPTMMSPDNVMNVGMHWLYLMARPKPGTSRARLQSAVNAILQQYLQTHYGNNPVASFRQKAMDQRMEVRDADVGLSTLRDLFGKPLTTLMAAVGLVLLAACANVANLLLARGASQQREIAMRFSLGATRARLINQALTECLLLAAAGCVLGTALAFWGAQQMVHFLPGTQRLGLQASPDGGVLSFTLAISLLSALLFGLAPAWRSTAVHPAGALRAGGGSVAGGRHALRRALVVAQVAFSAVLAVLAGLFAHSLAELRGVDLGFGGRSVITFSLNYPSSWKIADRTAAYKQVESRLEQLPGVSDASYGFPGPFQMGFSFWSVTVPGSDGTAARAGNAFVHVVAPHYLKTIGSLPIVGRDLDRNDQANSRKVAVVNQSFVREFLQGEPHPLDRVLKLEAGEPIYLVGVVRDIPHQGLREKPEPTVYIPEAQTKSLGGGPTFLVRSQMPGSALLPAIRKELEKLGPDIAMEEPKTIAGAIDESIFQDRILATLGGFFGVLALLLAAIGLYGVVAYGTAQRAGEFGVRLALGAQRGDVLWMELRDAMLLVAAGLAVGLPASVAASRYVGSVLFGVKPGDAISFAGTAAVLVAAGLAAAFVPARRSASMDPMRALRHE